MHFNSIRLMLALAACSLLFFGCGKTIDPRVTTGDMFVTVYSSDGFGGAAKNVNVFTKPQSIQGVTDEFGSVLLKGIQPGSYEVFANQSGVGSGKSVGTVRKDSLTNVLVYIVKGVSTGITPEIKLVLPALPATFAEGESIPFSADVEDQDTSPGDITVKWESSIDGLFHTSSPDQNGNVAFSKALSKGLHLITVTATDKDKYTATITFQLATNAPKAVKLVSAVKQGANVALTWNKYTAADFKTYEVYRSEEQNSSNVTLVGSAANSNTLTMTDSLAPFLPQAYYFVRVVTTEGLFSNSNSLKVDNPAGSVFFFTPFDVVMHPTRNKLYMVDNGAGKLRLIDIDSFTEVASTSLQGTAGNIDVADNSFGMEVYVPSSDGWIYIYDAEKLTLKKSISTGLSTPCVVTNGHGYIAASVRPSPWWEQPVRTYSRATGINIDGNGDFEGDRLRFVPGQEKIISISTSVSPIDMEYFELTSKGAISLHMDDTQHGSYPLDPNIFRISPTGDYVVTGSEGAVYLATRSMEYKGLIQRGSLAFSDFAFSEDGKTIYAATQNRKSIQIARYPQLTRDNEILLRGTPKFIFYRNGNLISVSMIEDQVSRFGIEVVKAKK
ncbi:hypothetical protein [Dyadobacter sandarakinus]|uniref:Ig-like domain-containing protein n=1 Tax=Dyadobacter sandarakinus TaxID=2747268 RepID=A0ABX7IC55_9BACT|nr:hypothetical protein [Dyadobacter sandarakinus]QRR03112.1 hypothetical protein HWI92_20440 [Dyadobacter sandarakinus]